MNFATKSPELFNVQSSGLTKNGFPQRFWRVPLVHSNDDLEHEQHADEHHNALDQQRCVESLSEPATQRLISFKQKLDNKDFSFFAF